MAVTDQDLGSALQQMLIEEPDGGQTWLSDLWTRDEVFHIANQRQDRLCFDTLLLVGIASLPVAIGQHRVVLPDDWLRTMNLVWFGNDGVIRELGRSDTYETDHAIPTWELTNTTYPLVYQESETPLLEIEIAPAPSVAGTLQLLYIPTGVQLTGNGELLIVPDELEHAVRYGTLADLLSKDGRGRDPARAAYCEQRFQLAIEVTQIILKGWA